MKLKRSEDVQPGWQTSTLWRMFKMSPLWGHDHDLQYTTYILNGLLNVNEANYYKNY